MDPLTSLSVASNAVQLADFMFRIVHGTRKIYKSADGSTPENVSLEAMMTKLSELTLSEETVNIANQKVSKDVVDIATLCRETAGQLVKVLGKLKAEKKTVWNSFRAAVKTVLTNDEVETLCTTVFRLQSSLVSYLQFSLL
jgi:hypothetical protein